MKALKMSVTDEDGVVFEQYVVRDESELDHKTDEECDLAYDDPGVIYLDPSKPGVHYLGNFQSDLIVFLNRVNA